MLDRDYDISDLRLADIVGQLECSIELPSQWGDFFESSGMLPAGPRDQRRYPRANLRVRAALQYRQTALTLPRSPGWHQVYLKDISRGGVGFVHSEQLYPLERMHMVLPGEKTAKVLRHRIECIVEVMRCMRVQERCYVVGARFVPDVGGECCHDESVVA